MMPNTSLHPVCVEALLHCFYRSELLSTDEPAVKESIDWLLKNELIYKIGTAYKTTERGNKYVEMICSTPLPVIHWYDPREEKE